MRLLLFSILMFLATGVMAQDGLSLMKVEIGARPSGMAGAVVSMKGDADATAFNPASGVGTDHWRLSFGYNSYWENIDLGNGFVIAPLSSKLALHGGIRYAGVTNLEGRETPTLDPLGVTEFDAQQVQFKLGGSYRATEKLAVGMAFGWFIEKISSYRGSAFNVNFGAIYDVMPELAVGASVTNLGSDFTIEESGQIRSRDISQPTTYRIGGSYRYQKYTGALDVVVVDDEAHAHIGAEADLHESLAVRAGYMAGYDSKSFTAGASFMWRNYAFDYAFVPYDNDLGTAHLFNLRIQL